MKKLFTGKIIFPLPNTPLDHLQYKACEPKIWLMIQKILCISDP